MASNHSRQNQQAVVRSERSTTRASATSDSPRLQPAQPRRSVGNGATTALITRLAVVQRLLGPADVQILGPDLDAATQQRASLRTRVPRNLSDIATLGIPADHRITTVAVAIRNAGTTPHQLVDLQSQIQHANSELAAFDEFLNQNISTLKLIDRLFSTYSARLTDDAHPLNEIAEGVENLRPRLRILLDEMYSNRGSGARLQQFALELERTVLPAGEDISTHRAASAQHAADEIARMIDAQFLLPGAFQDMWKAKKYDYGIDRFGAGWSLEKSAKIGRAQWVDHWEYHIHGEVIRDAEGRVTSFRIIRGHIKPSANSRALGVSVLISNKTFENKLITSSERRISSLGNGRNSGLLARKEGY